MFGSARSREPTSRGVAIEGCCRVGVVTGVVGLGVNAIGGVSRRNASDALDENVSFAPLRPSNSPIAAAIS